MFYVFQAEAQITSPWENLRESFEETMEDEEMTKGESAQFTNVHFNKFKPCCYKPGPWCSNGFRTLVLSPFHVYRSPTPPETIERH